MKESPEWLTATVSFEGYPLALRVRPSVTSAIEQEQPHLGSVCHQLEKVRNDGMPEPAYNATLENLDATIHECLPSRRTSVMLVETFRGYRTYYACFHSKDDYECWLDTLINAFPHHQLEGEFDAEKAWSFYSSYRRDFGW